MSVLLMLWTFYLWLWKDIVAKTWSSLTCLSKSTHFQLVLYTMKLDTYFLTYFTALSENSSFTL